MNIGIGARMISRNMLSNFNIMYEVIHEAFMYRAINEK